ncbi:carboxylating nicotinate-nucleotide diphosphorylase [Legionella gresilensis]|uniref:carboxylating nicotinate-nucleotide diphosphorylase n=1 Tax=Legionella gresilensis TaxID=91823 RepID=UPI001040EA27|nr:carboxylating nicotinate-nucleotide diphosphorylase [Legionella gresilensis]
MINLSWVLNDVRRALEEDIGNGDVSAGLLEENVYAEAEIISREPMILCGKPWVETTFREVNSSIELQWLAKEGDWLPKATTLCLMKGLAKDILTAERCALNFLQTLSATATQTHYYVRELEGTKARLLDTRKTLPGLRYAQKYAVVCGGGVNHRMGLYDAFLIKENHIKACGSITNAIKRARETNTDLLVEVEVETIEELQEALQAQPDRILLDNFTQAMLVEAVNLNTPHQCDLEASGGINLDNIKAVAQTGVDYISVGNITKSIQAIDLSLLIRAC